MTLEQAQQAQQKAEADLTAAKRDVAAAHAAHDSALAALRDEGPATKEQQQEREGAVFATRSRLASAEATERRASVALVEAQERAVRLAPHVATLAKLDSVMASITAKDTAIAGLALDLHRRVAAEVAEVRELIGKAGALYTSLPVEVRTRDLNLPQTAALLFGCVSPDSVRLLSLMSDVLARRFGGERVITQAARAPRAGGVA